ncbi:MAG: FAD-binding oxidoreductase [Candidatus Eisenbacteria bacterium]|uniref:FAD-binding oxidoreductase n=1 Tax=Eiseniibacteriota bacterium TaxID=2212470 RepID=A0A933SBN5_UNCEI|nr:FAD-binding oxidoreductase [Candidatus Eisenbacteria bacterium]
MDLTPARHAISGLVPREVWVPASAEAVAEAVRECAAARETLAPWGGGVALPHERAPDRCERALVLGALDAMVSYEPDDFTLTAQCGVTIAELRETLRARGQELPLEAPGEERATLGGVLAANASGARRLRFGAPRDRILGARFVTGDGVLARTGGRVVKNVAGHAVHRLLVGSEGALGVFVEASLKLLPLPPSRAALTHGADDALLGDAARWSAFPRRECAVLTVLGPRAAPSYTVPGAPFTIFTGFEDDAARVADGVRFCEGALGASRARRDGHDVPPLWRELAQLEEREGTRLTFTSAHRTPDAIAFLAGHAVAETLVFHAAHGRLHLWPAPQDAPALLALAASHGFTPIAARGVALSPRPSSGATRALRVRISDALDPARVFALGDRWRER